MSPPHHSDPAIVATSAVTPIRPATNEDVVRRVGEVEKLVAETKADVGIETQIVRDLGGLVGSVLARVTEARDLAAAAKSEASQAKAVAGRTAVAVERVEDELTAVRDELGEMAEHVIEVELAIGKAPDPAAIAHASSVDLSPAEVAKLDKAAKLGTGLHRRVSEIEIRTGRKAAAGAALGTVVSAVVVNAKDVLAALAQVGWPGFAVVALVVLVGALVVRRKGAASWTS